MTSTAPESGGPSWRSACLYAALLFVVYVATAETSLGRVNVDTYVNALASWRIASTGSLYLDGLEVPVNVSGFFHLSPDGHLIVGRTPGQILLGVPAYWVSSLWTTSFSLLPAGVTAAALTSGAMGLVLLTLRRHLSPNCALGCTAVIALGTPVWTVSADALWTHPVTVLALAGVAHASGRERWWTAGAWFALGILARPHLALVALVLGVGLSISRRSLRPALGVGIASAAGMVLLICWNGLVLGTWGVGSGYVQDLGDLVPGTNDVQTNSYLVNLAGFLIAPDRGLLVWTPLVLVLIPGLMRSWTSLPDWSRWLAGGGLAYLLAQCSLNVFHGADTFFGYRLMLEPLMCWVPALALSVPRLGPRARRLAPLLVGLQVGAMAVGAFLSGNVGFDHVWTTNNLVVYLAAYPIAVPLLMVFAGGPAGWLTWRMLKHESAASSPVAEGLPDVSERPSG